MKLRDWSLRRWALVIALIILLPLIGPRLHLKWRVHRAVAELRADGLPTTWEELERYYDIIPEERNAGPRLTNIFRQLPQHSLNQSSNIPVVGLARIPPLGEPWPEPMRVATREYLDSMRDGLSMLYETLEMPDCRYARQFGPKTEFGVSYWIRVKTVAAKLSLECRFALNERDFARAARASKALFQLADTLRAEPEFVGQLVRNAVGAMAVDACAKLLEADGSELAMLKLLETAVSNAMSHRSLQHVIAGERAQFLEWVKPGIGLLPLNIEAEYEAGEWSEYREQFKVLIYRVSGLADQDVLWYIANSRKLESALGGTLQDQHRVLDQWTRYKPVSQGVRFAYWSKQFIQNNDQVISKHIDMHTKLLAVSGALAVARYRLQHGGKLPESLDVMVPEYLEAVPVEPRSGKPFELIVASDGYGIGRGAPVLSVKLNGARQEPRPTN